MWKESTGVQELQSFTYPISLGAYLFLIFPHWSARSLWNNEERVAWAVLSPVRRHARLRRPPEQSRCQTKHSGVQCLLLQTINKPCKHYTLPIKSSGHPRSRGIRPTHQSSAARRWVCVKDHTCLTSNCAAVWNGSFSCCFFCLGALARAA